MRFFDAYGVEFSPSKEDVVTESCGVRGLLFHKNYILLIREKDSDVYALPGGAIEENETEKQAVIREVMEETGLNVSDENFGKQIRTTHGFYYHTTQEFRVYHLTAVKITTSKNLFFTAQKPTPENGAMQWVAINRLSDYAIGKAQKDILEQLL